MDANAAFKEYEIIYLFIQYLQLNFTIGNVFSNGPSAKITIKIIVDA
jgi:hypothetical protein